MKPYLALLLNGALALALGLLGYFASSSPSPTALIPALFGLVFLLMVPGMAKENKIIAHLVVLLTVVLLAALSMPLRGAIGRGDSMAIFRVTILMLASAAALGVYVRSFIQARRSKK
jgi:hypothetical protein